MITIVGGTYHEVCLEPYFKEVVGSGLRACKVMLSLENELELSYHTFAQNDLESYLKSYTDVYKNFKPYYKSIEKNVLFYYDYPLSYPHIFPRLDTLIRENNLLEVQGENILVYGTIEGQSRVSGNMVVYDPQSPIHPQSFFKSGSTAEKLTIVLNWGEATILSGSKDIDIMKKYFFDVEHADVLITKKRGKRG